MKKHQFSVRARIQQQILRTSLLSSLIPLFVVGMFSILQARRQMSEQYSEQVAATALRINSTIFDITTSLYTSSDNLINRMYIRKLFGSDYTQPIDAEYYDFVSEALATMRSNTAAVASLEIYTDNPDIPDNAYITSVTDEYSGQPWHALLQNQNVNQWLCLTVEDSWGNPVYQLSLIRRIGINSSVYTAYLVLSIDANYLKNRLPGSSYLIMASVDNEPSFYSSDKSLLQRKLPFPSDYEGSYYSYSGPLVIAGRKQLTSILTFLPYKTDNKFYLCVSDPLAYQKLGSITLIYILILVIATIVPMLLMVSFSRVFSHRIQILKQALHQVSLGNYNILNALKGDDELTEMFRDLNTTVVNISANEARFYQSQIEEQQLINRQQQIEFKMLASQINPHFLYNTLETIRMQALASGNMDVVSSIKLLGKSMRYVLENTGTELSTLAQELEYIEVYLTIQKLRFGDRINYSIHSPEDMDLNEFKILPLLLQPIVENAVIHGLERSRTGGQLLITIEHGTEAQLIIRIADNGQGMSADQLNRIIDRMNSQTLTSGNSIGLYNINQRIKLFYGYEYGMTFQSSPGEGTTVTLRIPAITSKEGQL